MRYKILLLLVFAAFALRGEVKDVVVLQTADTHASLFSGNTGKASWVKMGSLLRKELDENPGNCILVDCGDTVQGGILASLTKGEASLQPVLALPYDVWVPGNHEMDYGVEAYKKYCKLAGDRLLSANFHIRGESIPSGWRMFRRNGAVVAVIGIQASFYSNWLLPGVAQQCSVESGVAALERLLPEVCREKPDAVVVAVHQGWFEADDKRGVNEVNRIAEKYPEVDLILGAHTHRRLPGRKIGHKTWYVQPGSHCEAFAKVVLSLDTDNHRVVDVKSYLVEVKEDTPDDPELGRILRPYLKLQQKEFMRKTGITLDIPVTSAGKPGQGCQTSELICRAMAYATGAEVCFHSKLNDSRLEPGKITPAKIFSLVPYENTIVTAMLTADELEAVMREQWENRSSYRYSGPWNMEFRIVDKVPVLVKINGEEPDRERRYKVAVNSHTAAGSGVFLKLRESLARPEAEAVDTGISSRAALEAFLLEHQAKLAFRKSWIIK